MNDSIFEITPGFLDKKEACQALNISLASLNRAMARKELGYFQMTSKGKVLFTENSLRQFLEAKRFIPSKGVVTSREQLQLAMKILEFAKRFHKVHEDIQQLDSMKATPKYKQISEDKKIKFLTIYNSLKDEEINLLGQIETLKERGEKLLKRMDDHETKRQRMQKE